MRVIPSYIAGCAILAGCGTGRDALHESHEFRRQGNYYQAYAILEEARDTENIDEELEREYWQARKLYLLARGQELVFLDRDAAAIEELQKVLALEPGNEVAVEWIAKARLKLADVAARAGDDLRSSGDLEGALGKYQEALRHVPGHPDALEGQLRVVAAFDQKARRAKEEHMQGVRKMYDRRYNEVWRHETNALDQDPSHVDARRLHDRVVEELAEQRFERAVAIQESGRFGAALLEFRRVQDLKPDYPGLQERIAHVENEVAAEKLVRDADMALRKAQFEPDEAKRSELFAEADRLLAAAFEITVSSQAMISEEMVIARQKRYETRYEAARDLELQFQFEAAAEAYKSIDADWPDGFMDVKARITDLEERIAKAEESYQRGLEAEQAGDIPAALEAYRMALLYYETYKGLEAKVKELSDKG